MYPQTTEDEVNGFETGSVRQLHNYFWTVFTIFVEDLVNPWFPDLQVGIRSVKTLLVLQLSVFKRYTTKNWYKNQPALTIAKT